MINSVIETRIPYQFSSDGSQFEELSRTRAVFYSTFNILAHSNLAIYASYFNIDLWNYTSKDGKGLKKTIDYMMPYYTKEEEILTQKEVHEFNFKEFTPLFIRLFSIYHENRYLDLLKLYYSLDEINLLKENLLYYDLKF